MYFVCCHFFLAFPKFKHINKRRIRLRNDSKVDLLQINPLCCPLTGLKDQLDFQMLLRSFFWKATGHLKAYMDFGVGNETHNRNFWIIVFICIASNSEICCDFRHWQEQTSLFNWRQVVFIVRHLYLADYLRYFLFFTNSYWQENLPYNKGKAP